MYIESQPYNIPILSEDVYEYVSTSCKIQNNVINEYMSRYAESHKDFARLRRGIYYRRTKTPFGYSTVNYQELIKRLYINKGKQIIGYETGASFLNKLGLTTQIPKNLTIATNNYRGTLLDNNTKLVKPVQTVNSANYLYLQLLDAISINDGISLDFINYSCIIIKYIQNNNLNMLALLHYTNYYSKNVLLKLQEIMKYYYEVTFR